jgi:transcriptional regulator with XRE-family HTH domain
MYATMTEQNLTETQSAIVAKAIREELARRRISRQQLADLAKLSLSTLEKALAGQRPFTLATVVRLEEALKRDLRGNGSAADMRPSGIAPETLGSYARASVKWIEGDYLTVRPSFSTPGACYAYRTGICWEPEKSHLVFRESERIDAAYTQEGDVSVPHQSGFVYLITNKLGQYRLIILSKPTISGEMFGILTTLQSGRGPQLLPVATPIVFVPAKNAALNQALGKLEPGSPFHQECVELLRRAVEEPFVVFGHGG